MGNPTNLNAHVGKYGSTFYRFAHAQANSTLCLESGGPETRA